MSSCLQGSEHDHAKFCFPRSILPYNARPISPLDFLIYQSKEWYGRSGQVHIHMRGRYV